MCRSFCLKKKKKKVSSLHYPRNPPLWYRDGQKYPSSPVVQANQPSARGQDVSQILLSSLWKQRGLRPATLKIAADSNLLKLNQRELKYLICTLIAVSAAVCLSFIHKNKWQNKVHKWRDCRGQCPCKSSFSIKTHWMVWSQLSKLNTLLWGAV